MIKSTSNHTQESPRIKRKQYNNLTLTPKVASVIVAQVQKGISIMSSNGDFTCGGKYLNVDPCLLPNNRPININTYRSWVSNRVVPKGGRTSLFDFIQQARSIYRKRERERLLMMAERTFEEDLCMDTTIKTQRIINGRLEDVIEILPKLRAIRSKTAMYIASTLGKKYYNTKHINVKSGDNMINVNTVSLLQSRQHIERQKKAGYETANV